MSETTGTADEKAAKAEALDEVIREANAAKKAWRPRHNATMARRLGRFEDELKRHSVKPSSPR